jgi:hypothetical protein
MTKMILDRRRFLRRSGQAVLVLGASGSVLFTDPERSWAITLDHLDAPDARTLLRMCRVLYPHDAVGDMYYAVVVEALDGEAKGDPAVATLLADGVARLDVAMGVPFNQLSFGSQTEVLAAMQDDPFFQKVRGSVVFHFYNNPLLWRQFGYEGASSEQGGYVWRGFQDAGWLVEPDAEASPAVAF